MTCDEFGKARFSDESHLVYVMNHKTISTSGPAVLCFSGILYQEVVKYFRSFRNVLDGIGTDKKDPFFCKLEWQKDVIVTGYCTNELFLEQGCRASGKSSSS